MKNELMNGRTVKTVLIALAVFSLLFGVASSLLFEILAPLAVGVFAALVFFDVTPYKLVTIGVSVVVLAINIILGNYIPLTALMLIALGSVVAFFYTKGLGKGECAGWLTVIASVFMLIALILVAVEAKNSFSWEAVTEYYRELYASLKASFIETVSSVTVPLGDGTSESFFGEDIAAELFDLLVNISLSILVIFAFVIAGISLKVFCGVTSRLVREPYSVYEWRFSTSSVFAYFYLVLLVLSFIVGSSDVFAICVQNLYNVFMVVYAYIGFNFAHALFSRGRSPLFTVAILIFAVLFASTVAVTLLSLLGVFFTVRSNKDKGAARGNQDN